jgi:hypothetical protein
MTDRASLSDRSIEDRHGDKAYSSNEANRTCPNHDDSGVATETVNRPHKNNRPADYGRTNRRGKDWDGQVLDPR